MLICNSQRVRLDGSDTASKYYQECRKEILDSSKDFYTFKTRKTSRYRIDDKGQKGKDLSLNTTVPLVSFRMNKDDEIEEWWYVKSPQTVKFSGGEAEKASNFEKNFLIPETINLQVKNDLELIFFLKYISRSVKSGRIYEFDKQRKIKEEVEAMALDAQVRSMILMDNSPIAPEALGENMTLINIAASWKIHNPQQMENSEIRRQLLDSVINSQRKYSVTGRGYKEFLEECQMENDKETSSIVHMSISRGLITFDAKDRFYYLKTKDGSPMRLCNVPFDKDDNRSDILVKYAKEDGRIFALIKESFDNGGYERLPLTAINSKIEDLKAMEWEEVKKIAKENNVTVGGKQKDKLLHDIATALV